MADDPLVVSRLGAGAHVLSETLHEFSDKRVELEAVKQAHADLEQAVFDVCKLQGAKFETAVDALLGHALRHVRCRIRCRRRYPVRRHT
jgi:hypothetical protein